MGTPEDTAFRVSNVRVDDSSRQESVVAARKLIQAGYAVNAKKVVQALPNGGVPTIVSNSNRL